MINKSNFVLEQGGGRKIHGDIRYREGINSAPAVVIAHGFKAFREWGFFPYVAEKIAEAGYLVCSFDFSFNGITNPTKEIFDNEIFSKNTVSREFEDLMLVIGSIENNKLLSKIAPAFNGRICLIGHSRGGALSIIAAVENKFINKICLWSSIAKFNRYSPRQVKLWREKGFIEFRNNATGQILRMDSTFIDDILDKYPDNLICDTLSRLNIPVFIGHGKRDMAVGMDEAELLASSVKEKYLTYDIIDQAGHTFGIKHPFAGTTRQLEEILDKTIRFLDLK